MSVFYMCCPIIFVPNQAGSLRNQEYIFRSSERLPIIYFTASKQTNKKEKPNNKQNTLSNS